MFYLLLLLFTFESSYGLQRPLVIGHRGTAYLPELSLASQSMAHAYGADIIEIDVCLSRDNHLIVIHDIYLDSVTDVGTIFPNRNRSDGLHYVFDFDLNELRGLNVNERVRPLNGTQVYPSRFPSRSSIRFQISTLNETIELLLGLNRGTGRQRHLLIEIKKPEYHSRYNQSISSRVIDTLKAYNLTKSTDPIIIQTFYIEELTHIRKNLGSQLRLFALMTWNYNNESSSDYDFYRSEEGVKNLSQIVQGLAPDYKMLVNYDANDVIIGTTNLTVWAHKYNLSVYPYTFRKDLFLDDQFSQLIDYFWHTVKIDGFITDHPDFVLELLQNGETSTSSSNMMVQTFLLLMTLVFHVRRIFNSYI